MFDINKATKAQLKVLDEENKNILVSAAAGSGKTTIMIEKIVRIMLDTRTPIENFLVLTFTKASAEDMKNKLINRLSFEEGSLFVLSQIDTIPISDVSNLHSFCARLLKSYFYVIGLDPTFSVIDETEQNKLKDKALDKLFEAQALQQSGDFYELADIFSSERTDEKLRTQILKLHEFSKSQYDFENWYKSSVDASYDIDLDKNKCAKIIKNYAQNIVFVYKQEIEETKIAISDTILDEDDKIKLFSYLDGLNTKLNMIKYRDNFEIFSNSVKDIGKFDRIPNVTEQSVNEKKACSILKEEIKDRIDDIFKAIYGDKDQTLDDVKNSLKISKKRVELIHDLVVKFDEIYLGLKKELGVLDFSDLEMFTLKVLEDKETLDTIKQRYKYIFVDEYQDINSVQEKIITLISSHNNRFMVGDIKQSIYGFRLCDPSIFLEKYNEYKKGGEFSVSISLNKNFRSHEDILEFVNIVFDGTMTKSFGGVDYKVDARLVAGKKDNQQEEVHEPRATFLYIDSTGIDSNDESIAPNNLPIYSVKGHQNINSVESKKAYLEGMIIANKISSLLVSNKMIEDKETRKKRHIEYKDIVILTQSRTEYLNNLLDVLDSFSIPISSDITTDVFEDEDILAVKNMLYVISNMNNDKPLFSLMYSGLFKFTPDELAQIKNNGNKTYFYENLLSYPNDNSSLQYKVVAFIEKINTYKKLASFLSVKDLCYRIIEEFNIEKYMLASANSSERLAKLHKFISALNDSLLEEYLANNDLNNINAESKTSSDSVRVMTIHKSKGLEFPVVFLVGTGREFNMTSVQGDLCVSKELGVCINHFDTTLRYKGASLTRQAARIIENKKLLEEEQRLLYVALTRAIDYLYVSGCEKREKLKPKFKPTPKTFMEWFAPIILDDSEDKKFFKIEEYKVAEIDKFEKNISSKQILIGKDDEDLTKQIENNINFQYTYEDKTITPQKTTVTKIAQENSSFVVEQDGKMKANVGQSSSAVRGTIYHKIFEKSTLLENTQEQIQEIIDGLVKSRTVKPQDAELINPKKIINCLAIDEFRTLINQAEWIKKETEFYMLLGDSQDKKDRVEVQGIIDLLIKTPNELVLIDYKTGYLDEQSAKQKYAVQLDTYRQAAEKIYGMKINKMCILAIDMEKLFIL